MEQATRHIIRKNTTLAKYITNILSSTINCGAREGSINFTVAVSPVELSDGSCEIIISHDSPNLLTFNIDIASIKGQ